MNKSDYCIVIVASNRFDAEFSSAIHCLAIEFSKNNQVLYFNRPYTILEFIKGGWTNEYVRKNKWKLLFRPIEIKGTGNCRLSIIVPRITLSINWLSSGKFYDFFQRINDRLLVNGIEIILKKKSVSKYLYFNSYNPFYGRIFDSVKPPLLKVYQSRDDISQNAYTGKHGIYLEEEAVKNADFAICTSHELWRKLKNFNNHTHIVNNAVDSSMFKRSLENDLRMPQDIAHVKGKVIGYTGNLDDARVDFELLYKIAKSFKNVTLLIVGPINSSEFVRFGLRSCSNILAVGSKHISELPIYLHFMDVAIIPFKLNALTKSIYPLKINEYLAAGRSVVSTCFSEDIKSFEEVIEIANDHDEFLSKIDISLQNNDLKLIEGRVLVADQNSWEQRVNQIWFLVEKYCKNHTI